MKLKTFLLHYRQDRDVWHSVPFIDQQLLFDEALAKVEAAEAAIRLVSPEHITPQGARVIRLALGTVS